MAALPGAVGEKEGKEKDMEPSLVEYTKHIKICTHQGEYPRKLYKEGQIIINKSHPS
jgi:hypothetical protein